MKKFYFSLFLIILNIFISSCSPKYEVVYIYHPPETTEGRKCIEECKIKKINCNKRCNKERNICYKEAINLAKKIYEEKLREYNIEYKNYLEMYKNYKRELWEWKKRKSELESNYDYFARICSVEKKFCPEKEFYFKLLAKQNVDKPIEPEKPVKPNISKIIEKKKRKLCNLNCNCTDEFNICFQNCGGEIEIKKICVENCD